MKKETKTYFRSLYISLIIILCVCLGWIGISTAWENTIQVARGEYKKAIEINGETIRILDFVIK